MRGQNLRRPTGWRADAAYECWRSGRGAQLYSEAPVMSCSKDLTCMTGAAIRVRPGATGQGRADARRCYSPAKSEPDKPDADKPVVRKRSLRIFGRGRSSGEKMEHSAGVVMAEPAPPALSAPEAPASGDVPGAPVANATQGITLAAGKTAGAMVPGVVADTGPETVAVTEAAEPEPEPEPPDPAVIAADLREAGKLLEDEQLADAIRLLVGVLRADPGNRSARLMIALVRTRQGRYDEALVALEDLRGKNEDLPLLLALSAAYCGAQRFFDAMLVLDKAIKLAPADPRAYLNLAWLHLTMDAGETGRRDAEAYYRRAVRLGARRDRALEVKLGLE